MDKHLNENEEMFFDLLDKKDFEQLTEEEKQFVRSFASEEEYTFQRSLLCYQAQGFEGTLLGRSRSAGIRQLIISASENKVG